MIHLGFKMHLKGTLLLPFSYQPHACVTEFELSLREPVRFLVYTYVVVPFLIPGAPWIQNLLLYMRLSVCGVCDGASRPACNAL